jgi:hypothetical protein
MIRLAITRHYNVAFGCVEPVTAAASGGWRTRTTTATASLFIEWVSVRTAPMSTATCLGYGAAKTSRWPQLSGPPCHRPVAASLPFRLAS